ncbi:prion-inhibition and propagation-domain-containing protein [Aspergillus cavernicola]|uniref:Prion-inhibition and propagation-domain-containing protein n=1 Tax=Aspergillus cavernicola TaxID=176166 RepID=A0ABR4J1E3_9EURO
MVADPVSIVSLSFEVFAACVQGFVLLAQARNLGEDASFLMTMLSVQEYRFLQWGEIVGINDRDRTIDPRLNPVEASRLMGELQLMLEKDNIRKRYHLELVEKEGPVDRENVVHSPEGSQSILSDAVSDKRRADILHRANLIKSKNSLPKRLWWAAVDKNRLATLVSRVERTVQGLWDLLNPIQQNRMDQATQEILSKVIDMSNDLKELRELRAALEVFSRDIQASGACPLAASAGIKAVAVALHGAKERTGEETFLLNTTASNDQPGQQLGPQPVAERLLQDDITCIEQTKDATRSVARYKGRPVLIEHKPVPAKDKPKLKHRVVDLATLLSSRTHPEFLTLRCIGFVEDQKGFSLVYNYPDSLDTNFNLSNTSESPPSPMSLLDLLYNREPPLEPSLSARLKLAQRCLHAIILLHTASWLHKSLRASNVLFFATLDSARSNPEKALAHPFLAGFNFSRLDRPAEISEYISEDPLADIYRHPSALGYPPVPFDKNMDLYSLGTVLIELTEWRPLRTIVQKCVKVSSRGQDVPLENIKSVREWLLENKVGSGSVAYRVGDGFGGAVAMCLAGGNCEAEMREKVLDREWEIAKKLDACHI